MASGTLPRSSQSVVVEHWKVCIAFVKPVETLKLYLYGSLKKRWELEETPSLCGSLNNDDVGKTWWLR
jgi:hypothetical protein